MLSRLTRLLHVIKAHAEEKTKRVRKDSHIVVLALVRRLSRVVTHTKQSTVGRDICPNLASGHHRIMDAAQMGHS